MTPSELEQQAFGRGALMFILACVFLYMDTPWWTIICCVVGISSLFFWSR